MDISWRVATPDDRGAVSVFECAIPPSAVKSAATGWKPAHPRMWEFEAQQEIRKLAPRIKLRETALHGVVGYDGDRLAGVAFWTSLGMDPNNKLALAHLDVLGVASRLRRRDGLQRGAIARSLRLDVLTRIEAWAIESGAEELGVEGEIFHANNASRRLADELGFEVVEDHEAGAQTWAIRVQVGGADL